MKSRKQKAQKSDEPVTTTSKIDQVLAQEENVLSAAVARTMQAYNQNSTVANLRDYQAAKTALEEFRKKKHAAENPEKARFTVPEAVEYLKSQGYKIEKSKLYSEKALVGYTTIDNAVTFSKKDIDKYAKKFLNLLSGSDADNADEKMKWDARIAEQKFKDMEFEAKIKEGMYVLKSEVEQMLAARAAFLKDNLGQSFIHSRAPKIAEIIQGNTERIPELIELWLQQIEEVFDYYSKPMRFEVSTALLNLEKEDS